MLACGVWVATALTAGGVGSAGLAIMIRPDLAERERRRGDPPTRRCSIADCSGNGVIATAARPGVGRPHLAPYPRYLHRDHALPPGASAPEAVFEVEDFRREFYKSGTPERALLIIVNNSQLLLVAKSVLTSRTSNAAGG